MKHFSAILQPSVWVTSSWRVATSAFHVKYWSLQCVVVTWGTVWRGCSTTSQVRSDGPDNPKKYFNTKLLLTRIKTFYLMCAHTHGWHSITISKNKFYHLELFSMESKLQSEVWQVVSFTCHVTLQEVHYFFISRFSIVTPPTSGTSISGSTNGVNTPTIAGQHYDIRILGVSGLWVYVVCIVCACACACVCVYVYVCVCMCMCVCMCRCA